MQALNKRELTTKDKKYIRGGCCVMSAGLMCQATGEFLGSESTQDKALAITHFAIATGTLLLSLTYSEQNQDKQAPAKKQRDEELGERRPLLSGRKKSVIEEIIENGANRAPPERTLSV